jgi:branched-chain amino acid transport system ATP-binding protein
MSTEDPATTDSGASTADGEPVLQIEGLESGYETGQVLFGVDMTVHQGERVSLLGRNGAGKTTTMRSIVGADVPEVQGGSITFEGRDLVGEPAYDISNRGIAFVPEDRECFPRLSAEENIQVAINHAPDPKDLESVLSLFPEIEEMRTKHAANMSGGEQQMLAIARALAANPDLMLLDEPSEGLAPYIVERVEEIIERINEEQDITVLFVEQNAAMAMEVADRHYVLDEGRIVAEVTTDELRADDELKQTYLGV